MTFRLLAAAALAAVLLMGCGRDSDELAREEAERQERANAAAAEMLAKDHAQFRELAEHRRIASPQGEPAPGLEERAPPLR